MRISTSRAYILSVAVWLNVVSQQTRAEETTAQARHSSEYTYEVLRANSQGRATVLAGNLGQAGLDATQANDEEFRENVKLQLTNLLEDQVGGDWVIADASHRELEAQGKSKVSKNGFAHVRFIQRVHGYQVEGASIMAHTDSGGEIFLVNGELLDSQPVASEPLLDSKTAISLAMKEAGITPRIKQQNLRGASHDDDDNAELAMVRDDDDKVCFAWKTMVDYVEINEDGTRLDMKALLYADTQTGRLCGLHPQIFDWTPDIRTYQCSSSRLIFPSIQNMECSYLYSSSLFKISTGQEALDAAHNNAIATYLYYKDYHGLESLDDKNMPVRSYVLAPEFQYQGAFWDRGAVYFGDGDPPPVGSTNPFSFGIDVAAHEFTHGVIIHSSNLVYSQESGALAESICDIMGIQVKRLHDNTSTGRALWWIANKVTANGYGIRDMADPESRDHYDYYPTRYLGGSPDDHGGVHWNSGIGNLAFYLFVNGGSHPRGKTDVVVKGLIEIFEGDEDEAFTTAGDIFFCAAWSCLTSRSTFADMRLCTTDACGSTGRLQDKEIVASMKDAWDAVGVL